MEEGLAHKAMCGWVFDSGLTIQSMSGCLSHRGKTFLSTVLGDGLSTSSIRDRVSGLWGGRER